MPRKDERWAPTDHACRECGGRVVMVTNSGPTGGGNPIFRCADCGIGSAAMDASCICWCGFRHKGQAEPTYRCVRTESEKGDEVMKAVLVQAGYRGPNGRVKVEIGVVSEHMIQVIRERLATAR
jgi:hypothetical protein